MRTQGKAFMDKAYKKTLGSGKSGLEMEHRRRQKKVYAEEDRKAIEGQKRTGRYL
jgi:hypothetical protein